MWDARRRISGRMKRCSRKQREHQYINSYSAQDVYTVEITLTKHFKCVWLLWRVSLYLCVCVSAVSIFILTELRDGSIKLWCCPSFGVEFLHLGRGDGFVGLARGTIHGLNPQDSILLIITGEDHSVSLLHSVEERPTSIQTWIQQCSSVILYTWNVKTEALMQFCCTSWANNTFHFTHYILHIIIHLLFTVEQAQFEPGFPIWEEHI